MTFRLRYYRSPESVPLDAHALKARFLNLLPFFGGNFWLAPTVRKEYRFRYMSDLIEQPEQKPVSTSQGHTQPPAQSNGRAAGAPHDKTPETEKSGWSWLVENVISFGLALLIVMTIRSSIIEPFKIPSGSMLPTLLIGDHIFVNKFAYGFKLPFSDLITGKPYYLVDRAPPQRGDIIVFLYPRDESFYYIKRVVGVPGDTIEVKNKTLLINGKPVSTDLVKGQEAEKTLQKVDDPRYTTENIDVLTEHLDKVDHTILIDKGNFMSENFGPIQVPPESLFAMGDNRDASSDSRVWGFVPYRNVKGKAVVIWLSYLIDTGSWNFTFRPERMGNALK